MNKQKHKLYMAQILTLIYKDKDLCNLLGFKGGTAMMFFHGLPRFSICWMKASRTMSMRKFATSY